ncbi:MAG: di-trans,poly-cis-decaprenylcistransferase [Candidatus Koribacter versatilis]|uniref:Isoprenyl transferase n=1 Tax=Candidatus Korobacter versatilis TaxID=658062 RepID=A0A932A9G5_9BACT|nr:di-trans,poly-cis-decaprenylcistransferase [Candidatus Koribacter versatilis]
MQSGNGNAAPAGLHVALVMDGNGRWAVERGLPRVAGHQAGAETARAVIRAAPECGIGALTLYGFSSDNWKRPAEEVAALMGLLRRYLLAEKDGCVANGVRMVVIGRRDRLAPELCRAIETAERETAHGTRLLLRLAVDYSARDAIVKAAAALAPDRAASSPANDRESFRRSLARAQNCESAPDVDLLIRTGGEQRLSDFLLWECAYAELFFLPQMWPEFRPRDLEGVVEQFHGRDRRYGMIKTELRVAGPELRVAGD